MIQWVIPMAGAGSRLRDFGPFKPFVSVKGRPILEWALLGIRTLVDKSHSLLIIVTAEQDRTFHVTNEVTHLVRSVFGSNAPRVEVHRLDHQLAGPAHSVAHAIPSMSDEGSIIVLNPDQYVRFPVPSSLQPKDAAMVLYCSFSPKSSYAIVEDGGIIRTAEKEVISATASAGVYMYGSRHLLDYCVREGIEKSPHIAGELYLAPLMEYVPNQGGRIYPIAATIKLDLGDAESIRLFESVSEHLSGQ